MPADTSNERLIPSPSLIKPHLERRAGSDHKLDGITIERAFEKQSLVGSAGVEPNQHILVFPTGKATKLYWHMDRQKHVATFSKGDGIFNPVGFNAQPQWASDIELMLVALDPNKLTYLAEEMDYTQLTFRPQFHFQDALLYQLVQHLIREFEQPAPHDQLYLDALAHSLFAHLLKTHADSGALSSSQQNGLPVKALKEVLDYIHDYLQEDVSLEAMSQLSGFSPSYFIRLFKQSTGLSPHQYVLKRRIEQAEYLLRNSAKSIAEIALLTGFSDQSHLTRVMRQQLGATPKQIRQR